MKAVLKQQLELNKKRIWVVSAILGFLFVTTWCSTILANRQYEKFNSYYATAPDSITSADSITAPDSITSADSITAPDTTNGVIYEGEDYSEDGGYSIFDNMIYDSKTRRFAEAMFIITIIVCTVFVTILCLAKGSGCADDLIFKDTSYLMKTVPKSSWVIFTGKMLIGLLEFFIYCVLFAIFLIVFFAIAYRGCSFFESLGQILYGGYKFFGDWLSLSVITLLAFVFMQNVVNFSMTIYYALCRDKRWTKILLVVLEIMFIVFAVKVTTFFIDFGNFDLIREVSDLWPPVLILSGVGFVYFALTCIVYDKKINL